MLQVVLQITAFIVAGVLGLPPADPLVLAGLLCATSTVLVGLTVTWVRVRARGAEALRSLVGEHRPTWGDAVAGILYGIIGTVLITFALEIGLTLLLRSLGIQLSPPQEQLRALVTGSAAPVAIIAIVGLAPLGEELFFRGMLFQAIQGRLGFWPAATASGTVFGLAHVISNRFGVEQAFLALVTAVLGIYLAWIFRRRGTLLAPVLVHAAFNTLGIVLIRANLG
jgi:membrane protease YdiL (CAAX protease family)